jgi:galactose mutarotase-like enzyme
LCQAYNEGTEAAPFATGWHPYFRLPAKSIDLLHMTMEAGETYIIDEQMYEPHVTYSRESLMCRASAVKTDTLF